MKLRRPRNDEKEMPGRADVVIPDAAQRRPGICFSMCIKPKADSGFRRDEAAATPE
jgi:hypothetical protein